MAKMSLGGYTFLVNPDDPLPIIKKRRSVVGKKTYSSAVTFSWPATIAGVLLPLTFKYMPTAMFTAIDTKYIAGGSYVFDPQLGDSKTYNVEIMAFDGEYHHHFDDAAGHHYKNVTLELYFLSEVT